VHDILRCSFCNKSKGEVRKLIAGPKVSICDECVETCNDIIDDEFDVARQQCVDPAPRRAVRELRE